MEINIDKLNMDNIEKTIENTSKEDIIKFFRSELFVYSKNYKRMIFKDKINILEGEINVLKKEIKDLNKKISLIGYIINKD